MLPNYDLAPVGNNPGLGPVVVGEPAPCQAQNQAPNLWDVPLRLAVLSRD